MPDLEVREDCIYNRAERRRVHKASEMLIMLGASTMVVRFLTGFTSGVMRSVADSLLLGLLCVTLSKGLTLMRRTRAEKVALGRRLAPELAAVYGVDLHRAFHVGISPGKKERTYGGDVSWDVGFFLFDGCLRFYGDQCQFAIVRNQIRSTKIVDRIFSPKLLVEFEDPRYETPRRMRVEIRDVEHNYEKLARAKLLKCEIEHLSANGAPVEVALPMGATYG